MAKDKKSFFERLTGTVRIDDEDEVQVKRGGSDDSRTISSSQNRAGNLPSRLKVKGSSSGGNSQLAQNDPDDWMTDESRDAELTVDVYQTPEMIIVKTMTAGVDPNDLDISIARDMVVIHGHREEEKSATTEDFFIQELYWGSFSRTITLPEEIDVDEAEAISKHGLLILKLPKLDKMRQTKLKVKTI